MKHLSTYRKRNQRDSLSSGERNGNSLNQPPHCIYPVRVYRVRGLGLQGLLVLDTKSYQAIRELNGLESPTKEGESPLNEI